MLEHYIAVGQQRMRCGYTTGTCAAGAARRCREVIGVDMTICGKCFIFCPYTRKYISK